MSERSRPRWGQIAEEIAARIGDGDYPPGSQLPTDGELTQIFATSRDTIIRAMRALSRAGLVVRRRGKGTYIARVATGTGLKLSGPRTLGFGETWSTRDARVFLGRSESSTVVVLHIEGQRGFWDPDANGLTLQSVLGPPSRAGLTRSLRISAEFSAEVCAVALTVHAVIVDEFTGATAVTTAWLHPDFCTIEVDLPDTTSALSQIVVKDRPFPSSSYRREGTSHG